MFGWFGKHLIFNQSIFKIPYKRDDRKTIRFNFTSDQAEMAVFFYPCQNYINENNNKLEENLKIAKNAILVVF